LRNSVEVFLQVVTDAMLENAVEGQRLGTTAEGVVQPHPYPHFPILEADQVFPKPSQLDHGAASGKNSRSTDSIAPAQPRPNCAGAERSVQLAFSRFFQDRAHSGIAQGRTRAFFDGGKLFGSLAHIPPVVGIEERYQFARGGLNPQIPASRDAFAAGFALIQ
jgi:hypothetical protein